MSFLSKIFGSDDGSRRGRGPATLKERLAELEIQAEHEAAGYQGMPLNRAGDLCLEEGDKDAALKFYGRAIDALLEDQQREAARGVANKIIRVHPGAVRTLCTLTWLDLASHHLATALLHLRDYVEGVLRVNQQDLARTHVMEMARVVQEMEFLDAVADALDRMDWPAEAARVREWSAEGGSPASMQDPTELSAYCMHAAVGSNLTRSTESEEG
jgi:hypothetical protein